MISRPGDVDHTTPKKIRVSPSNFFSKTDTLSETTVEGSEFVISKKALDEIGFPAPSRGDLIEDPDLGYLYLTQSLPMFDVGAAVIGFRVRTG